MTVRGWLPDTGQMKLPHEILCQNKSNLDPQGNGTVRRQTEGATKQGEARNVRLMLRSTFHANPWELMFLPCAGSRGIKRCHMRQMRKLCP